MWRISMISYNLEEKKKWNTICYSWCPLLLYPPSVIIPISVLLLSSFLYLFYFPFCFIINLFYYVAI